MQKIIFIVLSLFLALPGWSQKMGGNGDDKEKLQSVKIAFITQHLDISSEQATDFWPMFNQFEEEKGLKHRRLREISKTDQEDLTDQKAKDLIVERLKIEQEMLEIEKDFYQKVIKVLSPKQAFSLHEVNRDFVRHLYKINRKRGPSSHIHPMPTGQEKNHEVADLLALQLLNPLDSKQCKD